MSRPGRQHGVCVRDLGIEVAGTLEISERAAQWPAPPQVRVDEIVGHPAMQAVEC